MNEAIFQTELLQRVDAFLRIHRQHQQRPVLGRVARVVVVVVTLIVTAFAGYEGYLTYKRRGFADYYESRGKEYFFQGRYQSAVAAFREADKLRPDDPEIQCYLIGARAVSEANLKEDLAMADVQCTFVITHHSLDAETLNFIGVVYGRNKDYEEAEKAFTRAIEMKRGAYDRAEYNLGKAYAEHAKIFGTHSATQLKQRFDYLKKAIDVNMKLSGAKSGDPVALYNTACDYALLGRANDALVGLNSAFEGGYDHYHVIAEDSDLDGIRDDPKFAQLLENRYSDVVATYEGLVQIGQGRAETFHVLGWIQLFSNDRSKVETGIAHVNRALSLNPTNSAYLATLAQLYEALGNHKLAIEKIKSAIDRDPSRPYYLRLMESWKNKTRAG
jgi:tetratricopeptide (TPR) repeat protein